MLDAASNLGGATLLIGASKINIIDLGRCQPSAALGARLGHYPHSLRTRATLHDRAKDFGNNISRLPQNDGVAEHDSLGRNDIFVVQGCLPHDGPSNTNWLHYGVGSGATRSADPDHNLEQLGVHLFGRVLVGDCPPRSPRGCPEAIV